MKAIVDELVTFVGRDNVAADAASIGEHARDHSFVFGVPPRAVVRPGSADEVRRVVAWADRTATALVPVSSGGPHFRGDTVPSVPGAVIVDLRRMDKILRVDRRNRMAVIEPGVTYPQLQAALAERGMRVTPPLHPRANKSVVAGLLERQPTLIPRYNFQLPEPLRSCGVVWGNGDVMFTGEAGAGPPSLDEQWGAGLVQADPKGPGQTDFFRLLTGAQGTFGIVTWAAVRCELVPTAHAWLFAAATAFDELVDFVSLLDRGRFGDEVLMLSRAYLTRLLAARGAPRAATPLPPWTLLLGLGGRERFAAERVAVQKKDALALAARCDVTLTPSLPGAATADIAATVGDCCETPWQLHARGDHAEVLFVATLDRVSGFVETARAAALSLGFSPGDVGVYVQPQHQGVTHHVELSLPFDPGDPDQTWRARRFHDIAAERLIAAGAYFSRPYGSWAPAVYNRDAASRDALRKIKAIFDPAGIMNPGKLCFGGPTVPSPGDKEA